MGPALSRFRYLSGLCYGNDLETRTLSQFKTVCVILHDPSDNAFKRKMKSLLPTLYDSFGRDMLIVTFIAPPKEWDATSQELPGGEYRNLFAESGFNDELLLGNLVRTVSPQTGLPVILITDNLLSKQYLILETSTTLLEKQLGEIGSYCTAKGAPIPIQDRQFRKFANSLGHIHHAELPSRSLAEELADTMALRDISRDSSLARSWAEKRLQELKTEMDGQVENPKATIAYYNYESAIQKAQPQEIRVPSSGTPMRPRWDGYSSYSEPKVVVSREPSFYERFKIDVRNIKGFKYCDSLSKDDLEQYNLLLRSFIPKKRPDETELMYINPKTETIRRYNPLVCYFNEFLEREINLTVVQLMRSKFDIEMPEYYRRYKPRVIANVDTSVSDYSPVTTVKLNTRNRNNHNELTPLMLGQAFYAFCTMCKPDFSPGVTNPFDPRFFEDWQTLVTIRNQSSHAQYKKEDVLDYMKFQAFHRAFTTMLERHLRKMEDIKLELKAADR